MRSVRFLAPLALLIPLAAPAQAPAAESVVNVMDFVFVAKDVQVQPGDTVTWNFQNDGHTTTRSTGDYERWDAPRSDGETYSRTFPKAGRYSYVCTPHAFIDPPMRGVVRVGSDTVATTFKQLKAKGLRRAVRLSLTLNEEAAITWAVKGASTKKVKKRYQDGKVRQTIRRLKPGRYSAKVTSVDRFADKSSKRVRFTVKG
jgi:plastocyanin